MRRDHNFVSNLLLAVKVCSAVVLLIFGFFGEVVIGVAGEGSVLERVRRVVVRGQRVDLHFAHLGAYEVLESACFLAAFAFVPILDLSEAHSG